MDLRRTIETLAEAFADGIVAAFRTAPLREILEVLGDEASHAPRVAKSRPAPPRRAPRRRATTGRAASRPVEPREPKRAPIAPKSAREKAPRAVPRRSPNVRRVELEILSVLRSGASFLRDEIAEALAPAHRRLLDEALAGLVERGAVTQIVPEGGDARDALYVAGEARKNG